MNKKQAHTDLKVISSGMFLQEKGWLSPRKSHEYEFKIHGPKKSSLPISFKLTNVLDDLDLSLWKINGKKKKTLLMMTAMSKAPVHPNLPPFKYNLSAL